MKIIRNSILLLLICSSMMFSGCRIVASDPPFYYDGEHIELIATAIYSIPGAGSDSDDQVMILEEDAYGRVLFAVILNSSILIKASYGECIAAILVMQRFDNDYVYFISEKNYLMTICNNKVDLTETFLSERFPEEKINELKSANAWGAEMSEDDNAFCKAPKEVVKADGLSKASKKSLEEALGSNIHYRLFRTKESGEKLYFVMSIREIGTVLRDERTEYGWYIVMLDASGKLANGKAGVLCLDEYKYSLNNIAPAISAFLSENSWNGN